MKQVIVLVAMVVLGVAIAGMVLQFKGSAETITKAANRQILDDVIRTSQRISDGDILAEAQWSKAFCMEKEEKAADGIWAA